MRKIYFLLLVLLLVTGNAIAQKKWHYSSHNYAGLLEGDNGSAFQLQTIQGIRNSLWFTGIGTGIDYYYLRSVPIFLSVNRNLSTKNRTPYLSLDGGINMAWLKEDRNQWNDFIRSDFSPALYWAGGVGYKVGLRNKKDAILLHVGYSYKQLKEKQEQPVFCINPPCPPSVQYFNYKLNRITMKLGWQL